MQKKDLISVVTNFDYLFTAGKRTVDRFTLFDSLS